MKLLIKNETNLTFKFIGEIFDNYCNDNKQITIYDGLVEKLVINKNKKEYLITITYHLKQLSLEVKELNISPKEISTKNLKFPRLPKKKC